MKTIEEIVKKMPETLEKLNLPEVDEIEIEDDVIVIHFEKYPSSTYFGEKENNDLEMKCDNDAEILMKIFGHLSEQEQVEVLEEMSLDGILKNGRIYDLGETEEEFIYWVTDQWNRIKYPWAKFSYENGELEYYDGDNSDWQWHPELLEEPAYNAGVTSYYDEMVKCLETDFVKELEK